MSANTCYHCGSHYNFRVIQSHRLCSSCVERFREIPSHIPVEQFHRYLNERNKKVIEARKKRLDKALLNLTQSDKNSIM